MNIKKVKNVLMIIRKNKNRMPVTPMQSSILITIMKDMITVIMIKIILIRTYQWKLLFSMLYVRYFFNAADVIQSIGLIISSLIIFFAGSDKGK